MRTHRLTPHEGFSDGHVWYGTMRHIKPRRTGHLWWKRLIEQAVVICHMYIEPEPGDEIHYLRKDGAMRFCTVRKSDRYGEDVYKLTLDWP